MISKLKFIETSNLPSDIGDFKVHAFTDSKDLKDHLAISIGDLNVDKPILSRIHSQCVTGESFFSLRCDCRYQLTESLNQIAKKGLGVIFIYNKKEEVLDYLIKFVLITFKIKGWIQLKPIISLVLKKMKEVMKRYQQ